MVMIGMSLGTKIGEQFLRAACANQTTLLGTCVFFCSPFSCSSGLLTPGAYSERIPLPCPSAPALLPTSSVVHPGLPTFFFFGGGGGYVRGVVPTRLGGGKQLPVHTVKEFLYAVPVLQLSFFLPPAWFIQVFPPSSFLGGEEATYGVLCEPD